HHHPALEAADRDPERRVLAHRADEGEPARALVDEAVAVVVRPVARLGGRRAGDVLGERALGRAREGPHGATVGRAGDEALARALEVLVDEAVAVVVDAVALFLGGGMPRPVRVVAVASAGDDAGAERAVRPRLPRPEA